MALKNIDTIQSDTRFEQFCNLALALEKDYGIKVWHSGAHQLPEGANPESEQYDIIKGFYKPLERYGYDLKYQVYCYGSLGDF